MLRTFTFLLTLTLMFSASAERQSYDRYQSIVDRQMFGPLPPGFDPAKLPSEVARSSGGANGEVLTKEQEKVKSSIRFSVINITPDGSTAVGFTDNSDTKTPKHYYLKVGERRDGWEVREADPVSASMTIVKDGVEVSLTLGGDSGKGAGTTERKELVAETKSVRPAGGLLGGRSLAERRNRRLKEQEEREARAREEAEKREAARKAEQEETRAALSDLKEQLVREREERKEKEEADRKAKEEREAKESEGEDKSEEKAEE